MKRSNYQKEKVQGQGTCKSSVSCLSTTSYRITVKENLTYYRRTLWERVNQDLNSYRFKWTKQGEIFVRKDTKSQPIAIENEFIFIRILSTYI